MKYPDFLKKGDMIGIISISKGINDEAKQKRLDNAIRLFNDRGYEVIETPSVRVMEKGRAGSGKTRANEFMSLWKNLNVKAIFVTAGGDYAVEMLEYLDFEEMKKYPPKWVQGFSDVTSIGFLLPTILDTVSVYADNVVNYGMEPLDVSLENALKIISGQITEQKSYKMYQNGYLDYGVEDAYKPFEFDTPVCWKNLFDEKEIIMKGRALGGCLDIVTNFVGTKFDKIGEFISRYKEDGIVWFLEIYDFTSPQVLWHLWKFKNAGYFENCNGIIFGRTGNCIELYDVTFDESLRDILGDLKIPVIYDADFGHKPPQIAMLNGALLEINSSNGSGKVRYIKD